MFVSSLQKKKKNCQEISNSDELIGTIRNLKLFLKISDLKIIKESNIEHNHQKYI